ncbi:MAG: hypothetical protein JEZ06_05780 [Anaerolineaceae bacterium]|nr:hypothetical protein [Anaerolineaceae bacterium]
MNKKIVLLLCILLLFSMSCSLLGSDDKDEEEQKIGIELPDEKEEVVVPEPEQESPPVQEEVSEEEEQTLPDPVEEPQEEEVVVEDEPVETAPDAPMYFRDELDEPMDENIWLTEYYYWTDEDVEEDDEEAVPDYSIEQERGVRKFHLESPWLYVYQTYTPYIYEDISITLEVENKGVNSNNISLFCRSTDYGWYEFIATSGGYYSIMRYHEDGDEELAGGGIRSIYFGENKKNRFTIICNSKTLTYIVNDVEIAQVKDEEIPDAGHAGFNISAESITPVKVEVNWLEFSEP